MDNMHSYRTWFSSTTNANRDTFPPEMYQYINISTENPLMSPKRTYISKNIDLRSIYRERGTKNRATTARSPPPRSRGERGGAAAWLVRFSTVMSPITTLLPTSKEESHIIPPDTSPTLFLFPPFTMLPRPPLTSTAPPHDVLGTIPPVHENLPHQRILQYFLLQSLGQGQGGENYACGCGARPRPALSRLVVKPRAPEQPQGA